MLDHLIAGGTVVDGSGHPGRQADVGIKGGVIVDIGVIDEPAKERFDATGLIVAPGFVDPHTHYDAQLFWDAAAAPSSSHGVTTVVSGNCGFSLAPLQANDADYIRKMMGRVEGMPLGALETGVPWSWESFGDYLSSLEGRIAVNAGFMAGHTALRLYTMGGRALEEPADEDDLAAMAKLLHASIEAGALGLSTSMSSTHNDGAGNPIASRKATAGELVALARVVGEHEGTNLEVMLNGCVAPDGFTDEEVRLLLDMTSAARRPLNWNVLNAPEAVDDDVRARVARQLLPGTLAAERGGRIVALTMPNDYPVTASFLTHCAMQMLPGWPAVFRLPVPDRMEKLRDPDVRAALYAGAKSKEAGVLGRHSFFERYRIGDTYGPANAGLSGRLVGDIAAERGQHPFDALVDIVLVDDLRTTLWPVREESDETWRLREELWADPRAILGGSDAGAHLDRACGAVYTTAFLAEAIRGRQLVSVERAVQMITDEPARLFGLRDRGRLAAGYHADVVLFDPETVGTGDARFVADLPGGSARLSAPSAGISRVYVNGQVAVVDGNPTGLRAGSVLRSSSDTATPTLPSPVSAGTA